MSFLGLHFLKNLGGSVVMNCACQSSYCDKNSSALTFVDRRASENVSLEKSNSVVKVLTHLPFGSFVNQNWKMYS